VTVQPPDGIDCARVKLAISGRPGNGLSLVKHRHPNQPFAYAKAILSLRSTHHLQMSSAPSTLHEAGTVIVAGGAASLARERGLIG